MINLNIKMEGLEQLLSNLDATKAVAIQRRALKQGARVIQSAVVAAAPEQVSYHDGSNALPPGALKSDYYFFIKRGTPVPTVMIKFGKFTAHVARWLEYGFTHSHRNKKTGQIIKGKFVQHPFFRAAEEGAEAEALKAVQVSLATDISKAYKGQLPPGEE